MKRRILIVLTITTVLLFVVSLFVGTTKLNLIDQVKALFGNGNNNHVVIMQKIRLPRSLAALFVGGGLSVAGLIMQTSLSNDMASPSTLGVSHAAIFGANVAIIVFSGGFLITGNNIQNYLSNSNFYSTSLIAFIFSTISILIVLSLGKIKSFSRESIILIGIALSAIWQALTSLLQYYSSDVSLSAAVVWSFGDLSRADFKIDVIIGVITTIVSIFFMVNSNKYNSMLLGDDISKTQGLKVERFRFISLLLSSIVISVCISNIGIIGFVGLVCPHIVKRILGYNHKVTILASILMGSIMLLIADTLARIIGAGSSIPVGIVTSIIGAPFFLYIIFRRRSYND